MFRYGINPLKLRAVFISHLHGDHVFGLFPLISTLGLYGRRTPLKIFGPAPLGEMLGCHLRYFDTQLPYEIEWVEVDTTRHALLFENRTLEVWSVPLRHRIPTSGYLFREKQPPLNVRKEKITEYGLSIARITAAKRGEDILLDNGDTLPNAELTYRPYAPRSYAYLSDTSWSPKAAKLVEGADLLYHETTYAHAEHKIAASRGHSTTVEAARIAHQSRRRTARNRTLLVPLQGRERSGRRGPHGISRYPPGHRRHNIHDRKTAATMTKAEIQLVRSLADKRSRTEHGLFVAEGHKFIGELCTSALRVRKIFALEGLFEGGEVETVSSREMERLSLLKTPSDSLALVEIPHHPFRPDTAQRELVLALDRCRTRATWAQSSAWRTGSASPRSSVPQRPGRLLQPEGRAGDHGGHPAGQSPLHGPRTVPGTGSGAEYSRLRDFPRGGKHLLDTPYAGRDRPDGQRRPRDRLRPPHDTYRTNCSSRPIPPTATVRNRST